MQHVQNTHTKRVHKRIMRCICFVCVVLCLIACDQLTKLLARTYLDPKKPVTLIQGVFDLSLVYNKGAAFSLGEGKRWLFIAIALIVCVIIARWIYTYDTMPWYLVVSFAFVFAGAIGNLIDRICFSYVVDFLNFSLIRFPVFNFADIFISVGIISSCIILTFFHKA